MSDFDRTPPYSREAEEGVLGSILIDPGTISDVSAFLKPESFYYQINQWIYEALLSLYDGREAIDFLTLKEKLKQNGHLEEVGGEPYLVDLLNAVPLPIHAVDYAKLVENAALRRKLISASKDIYDLAFEEAEDVNVVLDKAEQKLFGINEERTTRDLTPIRHTASDVIDRIEELRENKGQMPGIPTGFTMLDKMLGGLNKSDLVILASRPGMGKTSFMLALMMTAARRYNKHVAMFNLEMSSEQLLMRMLSAETRIDSHRLRAGNIGDNEMGHFYEAVGRLSDLPIYIDDTPGLSPRIMRNKARRLHLEHHIDLVFVDYLQLMQADRSSNNRVQETSEISRGLKLLARELNVPVVAAAQLNRSVESRQDKRPMLSDLRDSGSIEQDADIVMFIYRDDYYNKEASERPGVAEILVAKHRHGSTGKVELFWKEDLATFYNLQRSNVDL